MPDDDKPREFPVEVTVGNIKVTVTLLLKPGTTIERKPEPEQKPPEPDIIAR
jgi:hypothetical protein